MKKRYLILLSICFFFYSCSFSSNRLFIIQLYDENNKLIDDESKLKEFNVSFFDNSNDKIYEEFDVSLLKITEDGKDHFEYHLSFHIGHGLEHQVVSRTKKFEDATKHMGIRVEDKNGRYASEEIKLSSENEGGISSLVVKLKRK